MDSFEAAKVVHERIMKLEPENIAKKIVGCILLQELPDQEMIRLALGPDSLIQNLIHKTKTTLLASPPISPTVIPTPLADPFNRLSPPSPHPFPSQAQFKRGPPYWDPQIAAEHLSPHYTGFKLIPCSDSPPEEFSLQNQFVGMDDPLYTEAAFNSLGIRGGRNPPNLMDYPVKTCHYFNKGFCKHGSNCRYFHVESYPESYPNMFSPHSFDGNGDDHVLSPGSLEKLELEITELLKSRRGNPVSIAALPMMYYEKYGRTLQAEGYLTESQRHGKAGYSLTKFLARLKNSIRLIDRPHGQHAVILAEDAAKYMDIRGERNDPGPIVSGSRQIYLTFPADSTFTEEDVSDYFSTFGPVHDVRIPCQQKRMFGFVTFVSSDTVKLILSKGNPHYVCGARVLVKPYREKSKLVERKYQDKFDHPMFYHSHPSDMDSDLHARWESVRLRGKLMEEHEHALELEAMKLSRLQLARDPFSGQSCLGYSMNQLKVPEDHPKFPSAERFNYLLDVLNHGSTSDDNSKYPGNSCGDQESAQGLNLPDSPFASAVASSISAVI